MLTILTVMWNTFDHDTTRSWSHCQAILTNVAGTWDDGQRAWERLIQAFAGGRPRKGEAALQALSDIGLLRRLLDQAETVAVPAARRAGRSWAEIAARLGVTRQSAWEKWREMDDDAAADVLARAARSAARKVSRRGMRVVPDVVGLPWDEARAILHVARLVAVGPDPDGPPMAELAWRTGAVVVHQYPAAGVRLPAGAPVTIWLGRGGGAGDREPRRPGPTPKSGIEFPDELSEDPIG
jgi:hypothetical protein